ncbi:MAG TPA: GNAT family N-acetyltransferase [Pirellulales bacterium]|nr:GNAT family N-acetyltransferase [Pirellulales bacterium]
MSSTHIRWLRRRDLPDVLAIERASFAAPWSEADFDATLRRPYCFALAAEQSDALCGYLFGALDGKYVHLLNVAVAPGHRRRGVGSRLVDEVADRLRTSGRRLVVVLGERNLPAQLFYRAQGFRAVGVLRNFWNGTRDDAYLFEHRPGERAAPFLPANRIAAYLR